MTRKNFERLTDLQKTKVQISLTKCYNSIIHSVEFNEAFNNDEQKFRILSDNVQVHNYSLSNVLHENSFKDNLIAMFKLKNLMNYLPKNY